MAFTDRSDLFGAVHEAGINLVVRHIMRQRPSLFNYATAFFLQRPDLLCNRIEAIPDVVKAGNPLFSLEDPLPVLGTPIPIGLNFCAQFTDLEIDFHPNNVVHLPPELLPLPAQRLALWGKACVGLDCPSDDLIRELIPRMEILATAKSEGDFKRLAVFNPKDQPRDIIVLPTQKLLCFCLELFAVLHLEWGTIGSSDQQWLKVRLDGLEIVDLQPTPMEDLIECYLKTVLRLGILPRMSISIEKMILDITKMLQDKGFEVGEKITLEPAPLSAALPNNPAVEDDQLKVFINLNVESV